MPANGPDCAKLVEPENAATHRMTAATVSRPRAARAPGLLARGFPATAARHACRSAIPFTRSGVTAELTVCIGTPDGDAHKTFPADAAGNVGAGRGNLAIANGQGRVG